MSTLLESDDSDQILRVKTVTKWNIVSAAGRNRAPFRVSEKVSVSVNRSDDGSSAGLQEASQSFARRADEALARGDIGIAYALIEAAYRALDDADGRQRSSELRLSTSKDLLDV